MLFSLLRFVAVILAATNSGVISGDRVISRSFEKCLPPSETPRVAVETMASPRTG